MQGIARELQDSQLHSIVEAGDIQELEAYLKRKGNLINSRNKLGKTAIELAVENGLLHSAVILRKYGSDLSKSKDKSTLLHSACYHGHFEIVEWLMTQEIDLEATNNMVWVKINK
jgi:ankyrin repeat protein